jgi:hypothetical protein
MAEDQPRPYVYQMIKQALAALGGKTTNVAVRDWILERYPDTNRSTISCQIIICTVNHASRIHYPENQKPRRADGVYDFLFRLGRGLLEQYDPAKHGEWEIAEAEDGDLVVQQPEDPPGCGDGETTATADEFAMETHLRDYLAVNLGKIEDGLQLYADDNGSSGVEYQTEVGRIDLLAVDKGGSLVVIELKVSRGPSSVVGQLLTYKGWVGQHLANGKKVRGIIIAKRITDKIRYAVGEVPDVALMEYVLDVAVRGVPAGRSSS